MTRTPALALLLIPTLYGPNSLAQQEVGNGGDPVQLIFSKARVDAKTVLEVFSAHAQLPEMRDALREHFDPEVLEGFLLSEHDGAVIHLAMHSDVESSQHIFFDPDIEPIRQSTCARTNLPDIDATTIRFSLPKCRLLLDQQGQDLAVAILLHEASHHFGVGGSPEEEAFAWQVGHQLFSYWQSVRDRHRPHWLQVGMPAAPQARSDHTTTVIDRGPEGAQIWVWGGCNHSSLPDRESCEQFLDSGGLLTIGLSTDAITSSWRETPHPPRQVVGRKLHSAVPIQERIVIWGGCRGADASCSEYPSVGGIFDVVANDWQLLAAPAATPGRIHHTASRIGEGDSVFYFGGLTSGREVLRDAFQLALDPPRWSAVPVPLEVKARYGHSAVTHGNDIIIWGGCHRRGLITCTEFLNDGYIIRNGRWLPLPEVPWSIDGRVFHSAIVSSGQMVVWGGQNGFSSALRDGAIFDLTAMTWTPIPPFLPAGETGRFHHQASMRSDHEGEMLIFGGESGRRDFKQTVLSFQWLPAQPTEQSWRVLETDTSPIGRKGHSQAWLPQGLLVWGGYSANETYLPTGAILRQITP